MRKHAQQINIPLHFARRTDFIRAVVGRNFEARVRQKMSQSLLHGATRKSQADGNAAAFWFACGRVAPANPGPILSG